MLPHSIRNAFIGSMCDGPPRWNEAGDGRHRQQRCSYNREDHGVERPRSIEHRLDEPHGADA